MHRRAFLAAGAAALGAASAGCLGRATAESGYDVAMVSDAFVPQTTTEVPEDAPYWVPRDVPTFEVSVGDEVVWENTGARNHTVTPATQRHSEVEDLLGVSSGHSHGVFFPEDATYFSSGDFPNEVAAARSFVDELNGGGAIAPGERYAHTFETAGWYHYFCIPHLPAGMMGNVHVVE